MPRFILLFISFGVTLAFADSSLLSQVQKPVEKKQTLTTKEKHKQNSDPVTWQPKEKQQRAVRIPMH